MAISSLSVAQGATAHITANVLDQYGNVMPGLQAIIVDPGPNTSFVADTGITDAGVITGVSVGTDTVTATYGTLVASLPVTVTQAPPIPTSIQFTSP